MSGLAHRVSVETKQVETILVDAAEFPDLCARLGVTSVPRVHVERPGESERVLLGSQSESSLLEAIGV